MKNEETQPTKDNQDAKKAECLYNLWLALKDRYTQKYTDKELDKNDGHIRATKR
jgi:hypothetical protein